MNKPEVTLVAQLLTAMGQTLDKIDKYYSANDEEFVEQKKAFLEMQQRIESIL